MLLRMYLRWSERRGFKTEIIDYQEGDEAGHRRRQLQRHRATTRSATCGARTACTASCASRRSTPTRAARRPSRPSR